MARNYSDEELQGAVDKIVRSSTDRLYGALGNRRTDIVFSQVQDAAAGVFVQYNNSPYYVVALACTILSEFVDSALTLLQDIDDTVRSTNRLVKPIKSLSPLANARSALNALGSASSARLTSLTRIEEVPAFQRFEQSTSRFLADAGKSIRSGGNIVQTPEEARERLAGLVSTLQDGYEEILRRVQLLAGAIEDFDSLNLPATLSSHIIANARDVLDGRYEELEGLDEKARLAKMRDVVLDVLAARAAVRGFGALNPTVMFLYFDGMGAPYADTTHPAVPASLGADLLGPYVVLTDTRLDLLVDDTTAISVDLLGSYVAQLENYIVEDYEIDAGVNDELLIRTEYQTDVVVVLSPGTLTARDVCDDINADLPGTHTVVAEPYGPQLYLRGDPAGITPGVGPLTTFTRTSGNWGDIQGFTVTVGDWVQVTDATTASNQQWYQVTDVSGLPVSFVATSETTNPVLDPAVVLDLNRGGRAVRLTFKEAEQPDAVRLGNSITLVVGDDPIRTATVQTLGFIADGSVSCQPTGAQAAADHINTNPAIAPAGEAVLTASAEFVADYYVGNARTDPADPLKVVCWRARTTADVQDMGLAVARFTPASMEGIQLDDALAFRSASSNSLVNYGNVTAITATYFDAQMDTDVVDETGVDIELGPDLLLVTAPFTVVLADPSGAGLNDGTYEVVGTGGVDEDGPDFELTLARPLVVYQEAGSQPLDLGVASVGAHRLVLTSRSTLLDTKMEVLAGSPAGLTLFDALPAAQVGSTEWFGLPEAPGEVEEGDSMEFRDTSAQGVAFSRSVVQALTAPNLLQFTETLATDLQSYSLVQDSPAPSARLRKLRKDTYEILKERLDEWLGLPASDINRYFGDLRKLLNPLIVNSNPTAVSVRDASNKVVALFTHLGELSTYLAEYTAPTVEQVDRLLETYIEQGANRARDLLLEGSFSVFFNLTQDQSSYSGELQRAIRDVNQNDLPITKNNRNPGGEILESYEELDYENDLTDTEGVEDVELTGESYEFPGSAF
jgi:hypothetical protein